MTILMVVLIVVGFPVIDILIRKMIEKIRTNRLKKLISEVEAMRVMAKNYNGEITVEMKGIITQKQFYEQQTMIKQKMIDELEKEIEKMKKYIRENEYGKFIEDDVHKIARMMRACGWICEDGFNNAIIAIANKYPRILNMLDLKSLKDYEIADIGLQIGRHEPKIFERELKEYEDFFIRAGECVIASMTGYSEAYEPTVPRENVIALEKFIENHKGVKLPEPELRTIKGH